MILTNLMYDLDNIKFTSDCPIYSSKSFQVWIHGLSLKILPISLMIVLKNGLGPL